MYQRPRDSIAQPTGHGHGLQTVLLQAQHATVPRRWNALFYASDHPHCLCFIKL